MKVKKFKIFPLFWGLFYMSIGMAMISEVGLMVLLFILISILNMANFLRTYISVRSGDSRVAYKYVFWESGNATKMVNELNGKIA